MTKTIKIGFDLDGVLARHYLDRFWFKVRRNKERRLAIKSRRQYFYPEKWFEKFFLTIINRIRKISSLDQEEIKALAGREDIEVYLVTARFGFLQNLTLDWLEKNNLIGCFSQVFINKENEDPTRFKASVINDQRLNIFIDDDLEVLEKLSSQTKTKLFWLVPNWRKVEENGHRGIVAVNSLKEVFDKATLGGPFDIGKKAYPSPKLRSD